MGYSMPGIISNISNICNSTHQVCIPVYQRMWDISHLDTGIHGGEIFVISSRVYQARDISHLSTLENIAKCQRFPSSFCSPITHLSTQNMRRDVYQ